MEEKERVVPRGPLVPRVSSLYVDGTLNLGKFPEKELLEPFYFRLTPLGKLWGLRGEGGWRMMYVMP